MKYLSFCLLFLMVAGAGAQIATGDILVNRKTAGGMTQYQVAPDVRDLLLSANAAAMLAELGVTVDPLVQLGNDGSGNGEVRLFDGANDEFLGLRVSDGEWYVEGALNASGLIIATGLSASGTVASGGVSSARTGFLFDALTGGDVQFSATNGHSGTHTVTWTTQGNAAVTVPAGTLTISGINVAETLGGEKTFSASSTQAGLRLGILAGDPGSGLGNGSMWYNSNVHAVRARVNGVSRSVLHSGSSLADLATRNAADLTGTLGAAQLPLPGTGSLGGVMSSTGTAGQFATGINSSGQVTYGTPDIGSLTVADDVTASATLAVNTRGLVTIAGTSDVVLTLPSGETNDVIERRVEIAEGSSMTLDVVSGSTLFSYTADGDEAVGWFQFAKHSSGWKGTGLNLIGVASTGGGGGGGGATLPGSVVFAFDARLLTYADGTEIDDVNVWTAQVGAFAASQADYSRLPYVATNSSESGIKRTVVFDADATEEDVLQIAPDTTLSGEFSIFYKIKTTANAGILAGDLPPTKFIAAIAEEGTGMKLLFGSGGTLVESTEAPSLADSAYHVIEVHRNGSDLVEWFVDGVSYGSATNSEEVIFNGLCNSMAGNLECVVLAVPRVSAGDRTAILTYLE